MSEIRIQMSKSHRFKETQNDYKRHGFVLDLLSFVLVSLCSYFASIFDHFEFFVVVLSLF